VALALPELPGQPNFLVGGLDLAALQRLIVALGHPGAVDRGEAVEAQVFAEGRQRQAVAELVVHAQAGGIEVVVLAHRDAVGGLRAPPRGRWVVVGSRFAGGAGRRAPAATPGTHAGRGPRRGRAVRIDRRVVERAEFLARHRVEWGLVHAAQPGGRLVV